MGCLSCSLDSMCEMALMSSRCMDRAMTHVMFNLGRGMPCFSFPNSFALIKVGPTKILTLSTHKTDQNPWTQDLTQSPSTRSSRTATNIYPTKKIQRSPPLEIKALLSTRIGGENFFCKGKREIEWLQTQLASCLLLHVPPLLPVFLRWESTSRCF